MAFRINCDRTMKPLGKGMPSETTGGYFASSDRGKLVVASSAKVALLQGSSLAPTVPIVGVFTVIGNGVAYTSQFSTNPVYFETILPGEVLEVDYSTAYAATTNNLLVTTNIGYYFNTCTTEGIAAGGSSIIDPAVLAGYLDPADGVAAADTSHWIRLVGFDNARRVAFVTIPSSRLLY